MQPQLLHPACTRVTPINGAKQVFVAGLSPSAPLPRLLLS